MRLTPQKPYQLDNAIGNGVERLRVMLYQRLKVELIERGIDPEEAKDIASDIALGEAIEVYRTIKGIQWRLRR
jgi:hypothetical protein